MKKTTCLLFIINIIFLTHNALCKKEIKQTHIKSLDTHTKDLDLTSQKNIQQVNLDTPIKKKKQKKKRAKKTNKRSRKIIKFAKNVTKTASEVAVHTISAVVSAACGLTIGVLLVAKFFTLF